MRVSKTSAGLKVNAIAGTYVVVLGFDYPKDKCNGLLGFSILRTDESGESKFLEGMKAFEETDPGFPAGAQYPTNKQPIQIFQWADYSAEPGKTYKYKVAALKGSPTKLKAVATTEVEVTTESPENGDHDVYFNRGTAGSQEYVRRFGDRSPDKVPGNKAYDWLSRGLYEAMCEFITSCKPGRDSIRIAAYEFKYEPFLKVIKETLDRGVDIEIIYDGRPGSPGDENRNLAESTGLSEVCWERTENSQIPHNKFIVKLTKGKPVAVFTGGTNFSIGGIFGHSNVAHVVEDRTIAAKYLEYWTGLVENYDNATFRPMVEEMSPLVTLPIPKGTSVHFSPRETLDALNFYADVAKSAKDGLFMTFAFGMHDVFKEAYRTSNANFRLALMEKKTRPFRKTEKEQAKKEAEEKAIQYLRNMPENIFAIGNFIRTNKFDGWLKERLTGFNTNVSYIHNKFMLVDPLSNDPIVIAGSANFSDASTTGNDENMLIIRGNTRVADVYLGEYMRMFSHFSFRESLEWRDVSEPPKPLRTDDWWKSSFGDTPNSAKRKYFAQVKK